MNEKQLSYLFFGLGAFLVFDFLVFRRFSGLIGFGMLAAAVILLIKDANRKRMWMK